MRWEDAGKREGEGERERASEGRRRAGEESDTMREEIQE